MHLDFTYRPGEGLPVSALERVRAEGAVVWVESLGGWAVSSYAGVKAVLSDPGRFTSEGTPVQEAFGREAMLVTDSALHHRMRAVWAPRVTPAAMQVRARTMEEIAAQSLAPAAERLRAGETAELAPAFQDFVTRVIAWMFEVPQSCIDDLKRWNRMFSDAPALGGAEGSAQHARAKAEVYDFLHGVMRDRRERMAAGERPDDLVSLMVAAEGHDGLTPAMAADNLLNFFLGALDTTVRWLGNIVVFLAGRPDVREQVRADPAMLPGVMEEVMRLESVAQSLMRLTRADTELAGVALKAGDSVFVLLGAANRDPEVFVQPNAFRLDRGGDPHLGFGFGLHHCLGAATARQEARAVLRVLLDELPDFAVGDVDHGDSWAVWGPRSLTVRPLSP